MIELIFLLVFFVPMALMVTLNIVLHRTLPDVVGPWIRVAAPIEATAPEPRRAAHAPAKAEAQYTDDEETLEAA